VKDEDNVERCDICLTWVATHEVQVGEDVYHVCDKSRCQDQVDAIQKESVGRGVAPMKLLPEQLRQQLPPLYSQQNEADPLVICKFFHPLSSMTWDATEGSPVDADGYYDTVRRCGAHEIAPQGQEVEGNRTF
jgi:hypothetical protein